jgi:hypothetical protein
MQTISLWMPSFHFSVFFSFFLISLCPQYGRFVRRVWFELLFLAYAHPSFRSVSLTPPPTFVSNSFPSPPHAYPLPNFSTCYFSL